MNVVKNKKTTDKIKYPSGLRVSKHSSLHRTVGRDQSRVRVPEVFSLSADFIITYR